MLLNALQVRLKGRGQTGCVVLQRLFRCVLQRTALQSLNTLFHSLSKRLLANEQKVYACIFPCIRNSRRRTKCMLTG